MQHFSRLDAVELLHSVECWILHVQAMWDENGDWLDAEPESSKLLNKLLCRPLNHLWNVSANILRFVCPHLLCLLSMIIVLAKQMNIWC